MQKYKVYFWKYMPRNMFKEIKQRYKNRLNDYMNVYVCEEYKEMYDLVDKIEKEKQERDYGAKTWCIDKNYYEIETNLYVKTSSCCGYMYFNKKQFFMDTISHESTHAVIGYFNRKLKDYRTVFADIDKTGEEINGNIQNEELFCYMVGNIGNQIVIKTD